MDVSEHDDKAKVETLLGEPVADESNHDWKTTYNLASTYPVALYYTGSDVDTHIAKKLGVDKPVGGHRTGRMIMAAYEGHVDALEVMLRSSSDILSDDDYTTLARMVTRNGHYDIMDIPEMITGMGLNNPDIQHNITMLDTHRNADDIDDVYYYSARSKFLDTFHGDGYIFNSSDDIVRVIDSLVSGAEDVVIFPVLHVLDPRAMIKLGLSPTSIRISLPWVSDWLDDNDINSVSFWSREDRARVVNNLKEEMVWEYKTMETVKREAVSLADSTLLRWQAPDLLYKGSKRPRTDMSLFRSSLSYRVSRDAIKNDTIEINGDTWSVIPVTRYAEGMSRGLYYEADRPEYVCGTFYYGEPESAALLAYKTALRAFNKTDACLKLGLLSEECILDVSVDLQDHMNGRYPRDLVMTPTQVVDLSGYNSDIDPATLPQELHYAGKWLGLYANEDNLDQLLCNGARDAGYDIVVLESMVGSFQVVTEVLDTRSREDSFKSLVYVVD